MTYYFFRIGYYQGLSVCGSFGSPTKGKSVFLVGSSFELKPILAGKVRKSLNVNDVLKGKC